jgi:hypothetical protein
MPALHSVRIALVTVSVVVLAAACTSGKERASFSGGVMPTAAGEAPQPDPSTSTTALTLAQLVLAPDGLGPVSFGTQAARAMDALTQALGRAEDSTLAPAGSNCDATRSFLWKDFRVFINEVSGRFGGKPGLVGWSVGAPAASGLSLKTEKGIGIGSTVAAVKAAYGSTLTMDHGTLSITAPNGAITGELDGAGDTGKVNTLRAGASCAD